MKVPDSIVDLMRCPGHPDTPLQRSGDALFCQIDDDELRFPIIAGTPVLINEDRSIFSIADFEAGRLTTMDLTEEQGSSISLSRAAKDMVNRLTPSKSRFVCDFDVHQAIKHVLLEIPQAKILVIGAGDSRFETLEEATVAYTDVALAPDTHIIADAHDLPFADGAFDCVVAQAVLEHVVDPYRCVDEIRRVLKPSGFVYAVTPFMQQVHMGAYDFTRFTFTGHRRLFRWFDESRSGVANGPGTALNWSFEYFLTSFSDSQTIRSLLQLFSRFAAWPLLLFDRWTSRKRGAFDCASAYYFFGRLRQDPVSDRDIIETYGGLYGLRGKD